MAVVRNGHVAIIIGGEPGAWQLYDPNSGGGRTRIHTRPLFGTVVNPKGHRMLARAVSLRARDDAKPSMRTASAPPE